MAHEGLLDEIVYSWIGTAPGFMRLVHSNVIKAWNLPFGCGRSPLSHPIVIVLSRSMSQ